jgi:hypothetical protein
MHRIAALLALLTGVLVAGAASADPVTPASGPGVLKVGVIDIHGRDMRPHAVMEVSRLPVKLSTLGQAGQPFTGRIEGAVARAPF